MSVDANPFHDLLLTERELWQDGPPHETFKQLRHGCPVHWTEKITEYPTEEGYWSVTKADDIHEVSRVIGSFKGIAPEDDAIWAGLMNTTLGAGDPDLNPEGVETVMQRDVPEIFERCRKLIEERRANPTDDLTSVLVHAELDGHGL